MFSLSSFVLRNRNLLLGALAFTVLPARLGAQESIWAEPVTGSWFDAANWDPGVPTAGDLAAIDNGGTGQIANGDAAVARSLSLGGNAGTGTLEITDGSLSVVGNGSLSSVYLSFASNSGSLLVSGTNAAFLFSNIGTISVGHDLLGTMTIREGGLVSGTSETIFTLGSNAAGSGVLNLEGTSAARGVLALEAVRRGSGSAQFNFDGGILRALSGTNDFMQNFRDGDVVIKSGGAFIDTNGLDVGIGAALSGTGALTKIGSGTLALSGSSSYTGGTQVEQGTLVAGSNHAFGGTQSYANVVVTGSTSTLRILSGVTVNNKIQINQSGTLQNAGLISTERFSVHSGTGGMYLHNTGTITAVGGFPSVSVVESIFAGLSTVNNDGGLITSPDASMGVNLAYGGHVLNQNGGRISADMTAVSVASGSTNLVTNTGSSSMVGNTGVYILSGTLINSAGSTIEGRDGNGVYTDNSFGWSLLTNTGTSTITGQVTGVYLENDDFMATSGTVQNLDRSTIQSSMTSSGSAGVHMTGGGGTVINSGSSTITGRRYGVHIEGESFGPSPVVTVIDNTGGSIISSSTTSPGTAGVYVTNYRANVTNDATSQILGRLWGVRLTGGGSVNNSGLITGLTSSATTAGVTIAGGSGTLANSGTINGGVLMANNANLVTLSIGSLIDGHLNIGTGATSRLILDGVSGTQTYSGAVTGTTAFSGTLIKQDAGTWVMDQTFSSTRGVVVSGGELRLGNGGTTGSINANVLNNALLSFNRSDATTFARVISGTGGVGHIGSGTTTLTGTNTYSGATTVSAGRLNVNGVNSGTGAVTVQAGGSLGGTGSIAGAVTIEDGGILSPGNSAGTLSVGSLILNAASDLQFELGTTSDLVAVAGNLTLAGELNVTDLAGFGYGTYTLFQYGGSLIDNGVTFGLMPSGYSYAIDLSVDGLVRLSVFSAEQYWDGPNTTPGGVVTGGSGTWNNVDTNWTNSGGTSNFAWNSSGTAIFTGTAGVVTLGETINVSEMVFETSGYVITGTDALAIDGPTLSVSTGADVDALIDATISGTGGLVKTGAGGRLILTGSNDYTGGTVITSGTLQIGNGATSGSILGDVSNEDALIFSRSDEVVFDGSISGAGQVVVSQSGTLILTGSSSYGGGTTLDNGTLLVGDDDALGTGRLWLGDGTTFGVASGAFVMVGNDVTVAGDISVSTTDFGFLELSGTVDLGADTRTLTFTEDFSSVCFMGDIIGAGGLTFRMADGLSGMVMFCGSDDNTFTGRTTVGDGVELSLEKDPGVRAISGDLVVDVGGAVTLFDTSEQINPASTVAINGILGIMAITGTTTQTIGDLQGTGAIVNIFGPSVLTVNSGDFAGSILDGGGDPLALIKATTGTLTLSNANDYRGGTTINEGRLQTADSSALGGGPVALVGGTLAPVGELNIASLDWTGGTIASALGATTGFVNIDGDLTLTSPGEFIFTVGAGFEGSFEYAILSASNLASFTIADFLGNTLMGVTPTFSIQGDTLYVSFVGATSGQVIQNAPPTLTPETAVFVVNGQVTTASPTQSNVVAGLIFMPDSALRVFNTLAVTSGNFIVNSGSATITGGTVVTPGGFTKWGSGLLNLLTNFFVNGDATIDGGGLAVNGNFTAQNLYVQLNTLLKGAGAIFGNVFNSGTVAPGNSPGMLTINGNFTQTGSGSLEIEIASLSDFDRLIVSGSAQLAGQLQVVSFDGYEFEYGQQFAFLQADSISGAFDSIVTSDPSNFRARFLTNGGTGSILLAPTSYTLVAQTTNQRNVAAALDSYIPAASGDRQTVSIALDLLSAGQYPAAFEQIMPGFYESLTDITIEQAVMQNQLLAQRMSAVRLGARGFSAIGIESPLVHDKDGKSVLDAKDGKDILAPTIDNKWGVWVQGNGIFAKTVSASQVPNYHTEAGGFLVGADYRWSENFTTGVYLGYQGLYARYTGGSNMSINSALFGGYATYENGGFYADLVVGGGYNGYSARRSIEFGSIDRTARSTPNGGQFTTYLDLGYDWNAGGFTFGPIVSAQYTYSGVAPFTETGADSLDLRVGQQNANSIRTNLGGRIAYTWNATENIVIIPEVRLFWQHEFLQNPTNIAASLDGGAGPGFGYETSTPDRDSIFAGAGVSAQFGKNWGGYLFYNSDFARQDTLSHAISAGLNWKF